MQENNLKKIIKNFILRKWNKQNQMNFIEMKFNCDFEYFLKMFFNHFIKFHCNPFAQNDIQKR